MQELLDLLAGCKVLSKAAGEILADGKVTVSDLSVLVEVLGQFAVLQKAVSESGAAVKEIKDLTQTEVVQVLAAVYDVWGAFKAGKAGPAPVAAPAAPAA